MNNLKLKLAKFFLEPAEQPNNGLAPGSSAQLAPGYHERNRHWLNPVLAAVIFLGTPALLQSMGNPPILPHAVAVGATTLAMVVAGVGVMRTETLSANVLRYLALPVTFVALLYAVLK